MTRLLMVLMLLAGSAFADPGRLVLASTTSTQNSGLYGHILPIFEEQSGVQVDVVAVGTGQALRIARNGDADLVLVHHRPSEDAFLASGDGFQRFDVMVNDFVLVGPHNDPASVRQALSVEDAMRRISRTASPFVSRGDDSGTHLRETELWASAGLSPQGEWYLDTGSGMGASLNVAASLDAYTLSDRGTWISFGNKGDLEVVFEGGEALLNPYGLILLDPQRFPHLNHKGAIRFAEWITSRDGQAAIASYQKDGIFLFCPVATLDLPERAAGECPARLSEK